MQARLDPLARGGTHGAKPHARPPARPRRERGAAPATQSKGGKWEPKQRHSASPRARRRKLEPPAAAESSDSDLGAAEGGSRQVGEHRLPKHAVHHMGGHPWVKPLPPRLRQLVALRQPGAGGSSGSSSSARAPRADLAAAAAAGRPHAVGLGKALQLGGGAGRLPRRAAAAAAAAAPALFPGRALAPLLLLLLSFRFRREEGLQGRSLRRCGRRRRRWRGGAGCGRRRRRQPRCVPLRQGAVRAADPRLLPRLCCAAAAGCCCCCFRHAAEKGRRGGAKGASVWSVLELS